LAMCLNGSLTCYVY